MATVRAGNDLRHSLRHGAVTVGTTIHGSAAATRRAEAAEKTARQLAGRIDALETQLHRSLTAERKQQRSIEMLLIEATTTGKGGDDEQLIIGNARSYHVYIVLNISHAWFLNQYMPGYRRVQTGLRPQRPTKLWLM